MMRYYKGQHRDVFRTLWQKEDFDLRGTSSIYLRSTQRTAPWIGHQRRAGEREEDQRRLGGQRSKRTCITTTWDQLVGSRSNNSRT